jgi:hypothetical protein
MATPRYARCEIADIRRRVEECLGSLLSGKGRQETPEQFWERVEKAGRLHRALALYDQIAAEEAAWRQVQRESKQQFEQRLAREGRQAEAERLRTELIAAGLSQREAQTELVARLQPLDGTRTRAWETPDPWLAGRLFRTKVDQRNLLNMVKNCEDLQYEYDDQEEDQPDSDDDEHAALKRIQWARCRREERRALADARWRARKLKLTAAHDSMRRHT